MEKGKGETWLAEGETGQQEWGKAAASVSDKQAVSIPRSRSRVTAVLITVGRKTPARPDVRILPGRLDHILSLNF